MLNLCRRTVSSRRPGRAQNEGSRGHKRLDDTRCTTYRRRINYRTEKLTCQPAHCSGVPPRALADMSAPLTSSSRTTATRPKFAAQCSGVHPAYGVLSSISAPAASNRRTSVVRPAAAAVQSAGKVDFPMAISSLRVSMDNSMLCTPESAQQSVAQSVRATETCGHASAMFGDGSAWPRKFAAILKKIRH